MFSLVGVFSFSSPSSSSSFPCRYLGRLAVSVFVLLCVLAFLPLSCSSFTTVSASVVVTPPPPTSLSSSFVSVLASSSSLLTWLTSPSTSLSSSSSSTVGCRLPNLAGNPRDSLGFPRNSLRIPNVGSVKLSVIVVDFPDYPAKRWSPESLFQKVSQTPSYYAAVSDGQLQVNMELVVSSSFVRMRQNARNYGLADEITWLPSVRYINEAISLASSAAYSPNYDWSNTDVVVVIPNPDAAVAFESGGDILETDADRFTYRDDEILVPTSHIFSRRLANGIVGNGLMTSLRLARQVGYTLGLASLSDYQKHGNYEDDFRFVGDWSVMSSLSGELLAFERWVMQWLNEEQMKCLENLDIEPATQVDINNFTISLVPIEFNQTQALAAAETSNSTSPIRMVMIRLDVSRAVVVESRRRTRFDTSQVAEGPLVYVVDTSLDGNQGAIQVLSHRQEWIPWLRKNVTVLVPLEVGNTLEYEGVSVTSVFSSNNVDTVTIRVSLPSISTSSSFWKSNTFKIILALGAVAIVGLIYCLYARHRRTQEARATSAGRGAARSATVVAGWLTSTALARNQRENQREREAQHNSNAAMEARVADVRAAAPRAPASGSGRAPYPYVQLTDV